MTRNQNGHDAAGATNKANTRPWESEFSIERTEIVVETPDLRVVRLTLAPGQCVPWHWHSDITDHFVCLEGRMTVESRAPRARHELGPGDECEVGPKVAHLVTNVGEGQMRFLVIQGIGAYDYHAVG